MNNNDVSPVIMESPVINLVPYLHSSDCLSYSISYGFGSDALFFSVHANAGWNKTVSLASLVGISCSSLSVLLSARAFCLN